MDQHSSPRGWQIILACLAVIFGAGGGCTVGFIFAFAKSEGGEASAGIGPGAIWILCIVGGLIAGGLLAARVLRPPRGQ